MKQKRTIQMARDKICQHSVRYAGSVPEHPATKMQVYVPLEIGVLPSVDNIEVTVEWEQP